MIFQVRFTSAAEKQLNGLNAHDAARVIKVLLGIQKDPYSGKKLKGRFVGLFSVRVWPFRIVYKLYKQQCLILVIRVSPRKDAYK